MAPFRKIEGFAILIDSDMSPTPQVRLHSPPLVRCLAALDVAPTPSRLTLAERLGGWLAWPDAIALAGVLDGAPPPRPARAADPAPALQRVRDELRQAIDAEAAPALDEAQALHHAHQQLMQARLAPLRAQLRTALAAHSPALARLAALDAVLEQALAPRLRQRLAELPGRMARNPRWNTDGAAAWHRMLHAELDLRLAPLEAMLEALHSPERVAS